MCVYIIAKTERNINIKVKIKSCIKKPLLDKNNNKFLSRGGLYYEKT